MAQRSSQSRQNRIREFRIALLLAGILSLIAAGHPRLTSADRNHPRLSLANAPSGQRSSLTDDMWRDVSESLIPEANREQRFAVKQYRTLSLDRSALQHILAAAPLEFTEAARAQNVLLPLPFPDGTFQQFRIELSPIMESGLADRYPQIKTYSGRGVDDLTA